MKQSKTYEATDKMIDLIRDNYNILQSLSSFGIALGFGDMTVEETCRKANVDTFTFLAVVNHTINGNSHIDLERLSVSTLMHYLSACHRYFLGYQLPFVRRSLSDALSECMATSGRLIMEVYDAFARDIRRHMKYEERMLFPYIESLMSGATPPHYSIEHFVKHHTEADQNLKELKDLIVKYMPHDPHEPTASSNALLSTLYLIYNNEEWLDHHQDVEDRILVPLIRRIESQRRSQRITSALNSFANAQPADENEALTPRERDVIVALVQGMSGKQIADHLCISPNTVITHRRNIARKLSIHSPAGLTIYAIANGLVDIGRLQKESD